jgi:hypothetical protein
VIALGICEDLVTDRQRSKRRIWKIGRHFLFGGKERIEEFERGISKTVESVSSELSSSGKSEGQTHPKMQFEGGRSKVSRWTSIGVAEMDCVGAKVFWQSSGRARSSVGESETNPGQREREEVGDNGGGF